MRFYSRTRETSNGMRHTRSQVWSKWFQLATVRPDGSPANRSPSFLSLSLTLCLALSMFGIK